MLGVVDWGIGGLGFVRELQKIRKGVSLTYLSDTGSTPYGRMPGPALRARLARVLAFLRSRGATRIVIACNAASTVLGSGARELGVTGVIDSGLEAALAAGGDFIGVVGGERTIRSGAYRRPLVQAGKRVLQRIAQPLSAAVEAGELDGIATRACLHAIVRPLRGVDTLVLGCTHYPALRALFEAELGGVSIVDPARTLAESVMRERATAKRGPSTYLTTGNSFAMKRAAELAFGFELDAEEVSV